MISNLQGKASRKLVDIARLAEISRILGESFFISSLPGKASRTLVAKQCLPRYKFFYLFFFIYTIFIKGDTFSFES